MHRTLIFTAFGWLVLAGVLHFAIDVVSQSLRGKHPPGLETTTLYYGLHVAYALGQVVFGLLALWVATRALPLVASTPVLLLALSAAAGWFAIVHWFMPYWQPKLTVAIFAALVVAAWATRPATGAG